MDNIFSLTTSDSGATLDIFGEIGWSFWGEGVDAKSVRDQMDGLAEGTKLRVNIDSPGGSVSDAIAIFNILRESAASVEVHVQGVAASAASFIAMAADVGKLHMPANTLLMIHKPWLYTAGNSDELRRDADTLDKFQAAIETGYLRHWTGDAEALHDAIANETWYTAAEAGELFGAVVEGEPFEAAAKIDLSKLDQDKLPVAALAFGSVADDEGSEDDDTEEGTPEGGEHGAADQPGQAPLQPGQATDDTPGDDPDDDDIDEPQGSDSMLGNVNALVDRISALREQRDEAQREKDALAADLADVRAQLDDRDRQIRAANERAREAIETLERVTGQGFFSEDSESADVLPWDEALKRCGNDYAEARRRYPEAYEAYRAECRKSRQ